MASNAKDIQLRELKDTVSQLKTMISEQTELIKSLRLIIDEKSSHEKALQEQVDYLTKKLFGSSSEKRSDDIPGQQNLLRSGNGSRSLIRRDRACSRIPVKNIKKAQLVIIDERLTGRDRQTDFSHLSVIPMKPVLSSLPPTKRSLTGLR